MSQQLHNLQDLGPIVAAQKVVGGAKSRVPWMPKKFYSLQNHHENMPI